MSKLFALLSSLTLIVSCGNKMQISGEDLIKSNSISNREAKVGALSFIGPLDASLNSNKEHAVRRCEGYIKAPLKKEQRKIDYGVESSKSIQHEVCGIEDIDGRDFEKTYLKGFSNKRSDGKTIVACIDKKKYHTKPLDFYTKCYENEADLNKEININGKKGYAIYGKKVFAGSYEGVCNKSFKEVKKGILNELPFSGHKDKRGYTTIKKDDPLYSKITPLIPGGVSENEILRYRIATKVDTGNNSGGSYAMGCTKAAFFKKYSKKIIENKHQHGKCYGTKTIYSPSHEVRYKFDCSRPYYKTCDWRTIVRGAFNEESQYSAFKNSVKAYNAKYGVNVLHDDSLKDIFGYIYNKKRTGQGADHNYYKAKVYSATSEKIASADEKLLHSQNIPASDIKCSTCEHQDYDPNNKKLVQEKIKCLKENTYNIATNDIEKATQKINLRKLISLYQFHGKDLFLNKETGKLSQDTIKLQDYILNQNYSMYGDAKNHCNDGKATRVANALALCQTLPGEPNLPASVVNFCMEDSLKIFKELSVDEIGCKKEITKSLIHEYYKMSEKVIRGKGKKESPEVMISVLSKLERSFKLFTNIKFNEEDKKEIRKEVNNYYKRFATLAESFWMNSYKYNMKNIAASGDDNKEKSIYDIQKNVMGHIRNQDGMPFLSIYLSLKVIDGLLGKAEVVALFERLKCQISKDGCEGMGHHKMIKNTLFTLAGLTQISLELKDRIDPLLKDSIRVIKNSFGKIDSETATVLGTIIDDIISIENRAKVALNEILNGESNVRFAKFNLTAANWNFYNDNLEKFKTEEKSFNSLIQSFQTNNSYLSAVQQLNKMRRELDDELKILQNDLLIRTEEYDYFENRKEEELSKLKELLQKMKGDDGRPTIQSYKVLDDIGPIEVSLEDNVYEPTQQNHSLFLSTYKAKSSFSLEAGDILTITSSSEWSPMCSAIKDGLVDEKNAGSQFPISGIYTSGSSRKDLSNIIDNYTDKSSYSDVNTSLAICLEQYTRVQLGADFMGNESVSGAQNSNTLCKNFMSGSKDVEGMRTGNSTSNIESISYNFKTGARSKSSPFPVFPSGSAILFAETKNGAKAIQVLDNNTTVHIKESGTYFIVPNDCKDSNSSGSASFTIKHMRNENEVAKLVLPKLYAAIEKNRERFFKKLTLSSLTSQDLKSYENNIRIDGLAMSNLQTEGFRSPLLKRYFDNVINDESKALMIANTIHNLRERIAVTLRERDMLKKRELLAIENKDFQEMILINTVENLTISEEFKKVKRALQYLNNTYIPFAKFYKKGFGKSALNEGKSTFNLRVDSSVRDMAEATNMMIDALKYEYISYGMKELSLKQSDMIAVYIPKTAKNIDNDDDSSLKTRGLGQYVLDEKTVEKFNEHIFDEDLHKEGRVDIRLSESLIYKYRQNCRKSNFIIYDMRLYVDVQSASDLIGLTDDSYFSFNELQEMNTEKGPIIYRYDKGERTNVSSSVIVDQFNGVNSINLNQGKFGIESEKMRWGFSLHTPFNISVNASLRELFRISKLKKTIKGFYLIIGRRYENSSVENLNYIPSCK